MIDLTNPEILSEMKAQAEEVLMSDDVRAAFLFVRNMAALLSSPENQNLINYTDAAEAYGALVDRLSFVALPCLRENELAELFRTKIRVGLRESSINLVSKVNGKLLAIPAFSERDNLRKQLREALLANAERLGAGQISAAGAKIIPTIGNWLKKYNNRFGAPPVNPVERNQFLADDAEARALAETEKKELRRLIELYEYLKLSSQTPEGLEDQVLFAADGQYKVLRGGEWEDVALPSHLATILGEVFALYNQEPSGGGITAGTAAAGEAASMASSRLGASQILNQARTLLTDTNGESKAILNKLDAAAGARSVNQALAALLLLAQLRRLDDVLADDERFRALVTEDLKKNRQDAMLEGFRLNPTAPNFLARFLKIVLQEKLGLAEADALSFAQKIIPVLALEGEKYTKIITYDGKGGRKWNL